MATPEGLVKIPPHPQKKENRFICTPPPCTPRNPETPPPPRKNQPFNRGRADKKGKY